MRYLKLKKVAIPLFILPILALSIIGGYFLFQTIVVLAADKSWIQDFGYQEDEVHNLSFDALGVPDIPVIIAGSEIPFTFDTGCDSGFLLTSLLEKKADYTLLGQTEQLNRDGSHRGWSKTVRLNGFSVFGESYSDIETVLADWKMFSSEKFNGLIGLKYFSSKVITLDYIGRKIAVTSNPIAYNQLDPQKYVVLPLLKSQQYENLPFFEAALNGDPIIVYLDTGKNHSYVHNPDSAYTAAPGNPPKQDIVIALNDMNLPLKGISEVRLAQVADLPHTVAIELNSDQIRKNKLLITIDLISQKIIFRRL